MKTLSTFIISFLFAGVVFAQKKQVLLTINNEPVYVSEFKRVYEKNLDQIKEEDKDIDKNLDLFINYKLKLIDAYKLKLDTSKLYKSELSSYKNQLMTPYLHDDEFKQKLLKEAYERTVNEVRASHILISFSKKGEHNDSISIKQKLQNVKDRIAKGESFEKLAKEVSDDPSAKVNAGDLGYFSAFRMVYPFEEAAYKTKVGEVSEPFKTRFGFHILKVTDKRKSKGEFETAHILIRNDKSNAKSIIDSLYNEIRKGASFEDLAKKFSDDKGSASNGGKLPKFGSGRMVLPFEKAVLNLQKEGEVSKPFQTRFGWHIVKLIKNYPVKTFEELEPELQQRIRTSNRGNLSVKKLISNLKTKYKPQFDQNLIDLVKNNKENTTLSSEKLSAPVITIKEKQIPLKSFVTYIENKKYIPFDDLWEKFQNEEILSYYKDDLENIYPEYKYTLQEYKDGLLLFDLMKLKIWDKSQNNTKELETYFETNKAKYKGEELDKVRGEVINDYQKDLEDNWIASLRKENTIKINKRTLKKIKKSYNQ
ncbi:peptidylprolyl isomerase [Tenacibaculum agarivorans]|uniref:peptidylprolyl isomerase n=1 Tax=Tenacibaculum agarivorans TaxID=1908389 RepID=UPI00094B8BD8|nr:peptidylprolyl isomerase [Tenacibaculum agarivorans]